MSRKTALRASLFALLFAIAILAVGCDNEAEFKAQIKAQLPAPQADGLEVSKVRTANAHVKGVTTEEGQSISIDCTVSIKGTLDGKPFERTFKVVNQVEQAIRSNSANADIIAFTGFDFIGGGFRNNAATIFVTQKHWDEREVKASQLVGELFGKTAGIKEALVLAFNPPAIFGLALNVKSPRISFESVLSTKPTSGLKFGPVFRRSTKPSSQLER